MVSRHGIGSVVEGWISELGIGEVAESVIADVPGADGLRLHDVTFSQHGLVGLRLAGHVVLPEDLATEGYLLGLPLPEKVMVFPDVYDRPVPVSCMAGTPAGAEEWRDVVIEHVMQVLFTVRDRILSHPSLLPLQEGGGVE